MAEHVAQTDHVFPRETADPVAGAHKAAFEDFYERAFPRVYAFLRSQVASVQTAQELVGRVFLKVCRHWDRAPAGDVTLLWALRIAQTTLIDYWRVDGRRESVSVAIDELAHAADTAADPAAIYVAKERGAMLLRVVADLDEDDRVLLGLKFTAQRTNREIAQILNISEGAVSMRLLRALRRLRNRLTDLGIS